MHVSIEYPEYDNRYSNTPPSAVVSIIPDLSADGEDYDVLFDAVMTAMSARAAGLVTEVGVRRGAGIGTMMAALAMSGQVRPVLGIDPYGRIPYNAADDRLGEDTDYTNDMMPEALANIYLFAHRTGAHYIHMPMTDTEFMARFADGVPVYGDFDLEPVVNRYATVHFDGPHATADILAELEFFNDRAGVGSTFVFDDVKSYDHATIERVLFASGWQSQRESNAKMSYLRVRA